MITSLHLQKLQKINEINDYNISKYNLKNGEVFEISLFYEYDLNHKKKKKREKSEIKCLEVFQNVKKIEFKNFVRILFNDDVVEKRRFNDGCLFFSPCF